MSFISDLDIYEGMVYDGKSSFMEERSSQYVMSSKQERIRESLAVGEGIVIDTDEHLLNKVNCQTSKAPAYFEESLRNRSKMAIAYKESNSSISLTGNSIVEKWQCDDMDTLSSRESELDSCNDEQEPDEETIATFVTAAGQQLALYAVEDSDEIFAVAVYDESGESPTNFQFLMKADVERLIGEGAVKTVKKPTQMKKRLLTTQPPVFLHKEGYEEVDERADIAAAVCDTSIGSKKYIIQEKNCGVGYNYKTTSDQQNYENNAKINSTSKDVIYTVANDRQSDIAYLMMNECPINIGEQSNKTRNENHKPEDDELVQYSTVQYILFEDDQSDSELTFDEIHATLQNLKINRKNVLKDEPVDNERSCKSPDDYLSIQRKMLRESPSVRTMESSSPLSSSNATYGVSHYAMSDARTSSDNELDDRQRLIEALTDSPPRETRPRLKRSRKQQLTSMNRDDSEIIIQSASMLNEDELNGRKRGKRRRPKLPQERTIDHGHASKRIKKKRQQVVEVINLDIDEEEQQAKRNVVDITLDDSKDSGKYSSDKENEIITVRDSDSNDEEEEEIQPNGLTKLSSVMRCEHCSRNFRQRRTFNTHLRICQKSSKVKPFKLDKRKPKEEHIRKQYACKICQKKFDMAVALARHVRAEHSQRKKHKWRPTSQKTQDKSLRSVQQKQAEEEEEEEEERNEKAEKSSDNNDTENKELALLGRVKRKRKQTNSAWEEKRLGCADCGRWFPSAALLDAHSLQHGTKKSEQQLHKCQVCKKFIKSRLHFHRHVKMHNDTTQCETSSRPSMILRRKLRARPNARKITSLRKRGRPRKF